MNSDFKNEQELDRLSKENYKDTINKALNSLNSLNSLKIEDVSNKETNSPEEEKAYIPYKSKEGFVIRPVLRGFSEIKNLYYLIKGENLNCFICGGYVRYMASHTLKPIPPGDIDIYSYDDEAYEKLKDLLVNQENLKVKFENEVSLTFHRSSDEKNKFFACPPIQIIKPINEGAIKANGDMQTILENFDFTVIRCGLLNENEIMVDSDFENDEPKKILRIKNIHCPVSSTLRCMKYAAKGYWLPPFQALRLFLDWENRDEDYRLKIIEFFQKSEKEGLSKEEIEELESLMRID